MGGAAVVVIVGVLAFVALSRPPQTVSTPAYPNPNPGNVPVVAISGAINFTGSSSGYLSLVGGADLCPQCPVVPTEDFQYTPPVAGLALFLNVTNLGSTYHTIESFHLASPSVQGTAIFTIRAVFCCGPGYEETTESVGLTPGQTIGLLVFIQSSAVPSDNPSGYSLALYLSSAD